MVNRKAVIAVINNCICIDPSDVATVDIEKIKAEVAKVTKGSVGLKIAPIQEWMPKEGTETLMKEAVKTLGLKDKQATSIIENRHERRREKKKYGKRYF